MPAGVAENEALKACLLCSKMQKVLALIAHTHCSCFQSTKRSLRILWWLVSATAGALCLACNRGLFYHRIFPMNNLWDRLIYEPLVLWEQKWLILCRFCYREHRLTQLLKECLGSLTCHVAMIAHVSPLAQNYSETLTTVQLAARIHRMRRRRIKVRHDPAPWNLFQFSHWNLICIVF